jgi:hypothetical protein
MYVTDNLACSLPNSETPMPAAAIDSQNRRMAQRAVSFTSGDATLNALIEALGGNPIGAEWGNAGVPTTGTFDPFSTIPRGNWATGGSLGNGPSGSGAGSPPCVPQIVPLMTVVPIPTAVVAPTPANPVPRRLTPVVPAPAAPVSAPAPAAAPCVDPADCAPTPETICRNLRGGCYAPGQVSDLQTQLCAMAGWSGRSPARYCGAGWNGGARIPDMNRAPLTPGGQSLVGVNPLFEQLGAGMSGFTGGDGSAVLWGSIALGAFLFWAVPQFAKGRRT